MVMDDMAMDDTAMNDMAVDGMAERRARIAALDAEVVGLMAERVRLAREIGQSKRDAGMATLDPGQEAAVVRRAVEAARSAELPEEPVREIFWALVRMCRSAQLEERS
jgi:chorismate mutase